VYLHLRIINFFQRICENISSIEALLLKSENELKSILPEYSLKDEELRRLTRASYNLKKYSGEYSPQWYSFVSYILLQIQF